MKRRSLMDRRAMRIMAARSEANGVEISAGLRAVLDKGDAVAVAIAVAREIALEINVEPSRRVFPATLIAWFRVMDQNPTTEALEAFARDAREVLVNATVREDRVVH